MPNNTFSSVSSIASSLNFSLPPFFSMLSQKVANSSALELPPTPLLQKTSKASFRAYRRAENLTLTINTGCPEAEPAAAAYLMKKSVVLETIVDIC